jgi:hypothetical protein
MTYLKDALLRVFLRLDRGRGRPRRDGPVGVVHLLAVQDAALVAARPAVSPSAPRLLRRGPSRAAGESLNSVL